MRALVGTGFTPNEQVLLWLVDPVGNFWYPTNGRALPAPARGPITFPVGPNATLDPIHPGLWTFPLPGSSSAQDASGTVVIQ